MSDTVSEVIDQMDPRVVLEALRGHLGAKTEDSELAIEKIAKELEKSGVDCGPKGCRPGFVQRQLMNYAGSNMMRLLHQKISAQNSENYKV